MSAVVGAQQLGRTAAVRAVHCQPPWGGGKGLRPEDVAAACGHRCATRRPGTMAEPPAGTHVLARNTQADMYHTNETPHPPELSPANQIPRAHGFREAKPVQPTPAVSPLITCRH